MKDLAPLAPLAFLQEFTLQDAPDVVVAQAKLCLIDLCGVAIGGSRTELARIINEHAAEEFAGSLPCMFSDATASPAGFALAAGMTIDALDGHDGFNPAKGHVGCALLPGVLALAPEDCTGREFLEAVILGYELGSRLAGVLHERAADYHTSGAWMAVAVAAVGARLQGLTPEQTAHAVGIAEYHGPRSQMMRVIDAPTMLKDGSGWGAMAGVSAVRLAAKGFTGAPALTLTEASDWWGDLGQRWLILEQYFKPYPTCRWAHAPVEAALKLQQAHQLDAAQIERIGIETFHNSCRLACNDPQTTEQAQYSTSYPVAVALVRGGIGPFDLDEDALGDPEIRRLSKSIEMVESAQAEAVYPNVRLARVTLHLSCGRAVTSDWEEPKWEATTPPSVLELREKFDSLAQPIAGIERSQSVLDAIEALPDGPLAVFRAAVTGGL